MSLNAFWINNALTTKSALQWTDNNFVSSEVEVSVDAKRIANVLEDFDVIHNETIVSLLGPSQLSHSLMWSVTAYGAQLQLLRPSFSNEFIVRELNHSQARILFIDSLFLPLLERLRPQLIYLDSIIVVGNELSDSDYLKYYCLPDLMLEVCSTYHWPELDEHTPALISYEQNHRGVFTASYYSHRQMLLTALNACSLDVVQLSQNDCIYWALPLYNEMAWVIPLASLVLGCKLHVIQEDEGFLQAQDHCFTSFFMLSEQYPRFIAAIKPQLNISGNSSDKRRVYLSRAQYPDSWTKEHRFYSQLLAIGSSDICVHFNWENLICQDPMFQATTTQKNAPNNNYIFPQHSMLM